MIIPSDIDNYPNVYNGDISIGGLKMSSSTLYLNDHHLIIGDSVYINQSEISDGYITMAGSTNPKIIFSTLNVYEVNKVEM